jgi:hypothetical protein
VKAKFATEKKPVKKDKINKLKTPCPQKNTVQNTVTGEKHRAKPRDRRQTPYSTKKHRGRRLDQ